MPDHAAAGSCKDPCIINVAADKIGCPDDVQSEIGKHYSPVENRFIEFPIPARVKAAKRTSLNLTFIRDTYAGMLRATTKKKGVQMVNRKKQCKLPPL